MNGLLGRSALGRFILGRPLFATRRTSQVVAVEARITKAYSARIEITSSM